MRKRLPLMLGIAAVALALSAFWRLSKWSARGGEETPLYSSQRYDPYGTAAIRELLDESGVAVETLDTARIDPSRKGVLVQTMYLYDKDDFGEDFYIKTGQLQIDSIVKWIEDGNTLFVLSRSVTRIERELWLVETETATSESSVEFPLEYEKNRVQKDEIAGKAPDKTFVTYTEAALATDEFPISSEVGPMLLKSPRNLRETYDAAIAKDHAAKILATTEKGAIVAIEVRHGKGRVVLVGSPSPLLNDGIARGGNLKFALWALGDGPVIFDEWSHGQRRYGTIMGLIKKGGFLPVIVQAIFVIVLYVWSTMGAPPENEEEVHRRRSSLEQIETLGWLYAQSLDPTESLSRVRGEALRRMALAMRTRPAEVVRNIGTLDKRWNAKAKEIFRLIDESPKLAEERVGGRFDSRLARILNLSKEFEEGVKSERKHSRRHS